ncbi:MAG: transglycosylase SLT domain-containing protein [Gemmatimonadaceae bacterium]|nr:transglycosylase SLT domain-containing protein [Gemmatimonadaceae bacterium]
MKDLRGTYVHRGDAERFRRRVQRGIIAVGVAVTAAMAWERAPATEAVADVAPIPIWRAATLAERMAAVDSARSATQRLQRWNKVYTFSRRWLVDTRMAEQIHDAAIETGLDPELAFRLVNVESRFIQRATSPVGAIGLAQVMLPTARIYQADITREQLYEPATNLRIGFRYLRDLLDEHRGDLKLALLTYNRGGVAVQNELALGLDPSNGYDTKVARGYRGSARIKKQLLVSR